MSKPRVFYHCYDNNSRNGGQKDTYQHVDLLNRNGIEAYALHVRHGFRISWFENDTRVIDLEGFRSRCDPERDFVVLPEDLGRETTSYPGRKVIFNKNLYLGFRALIRDSSISDPYRLPETVAVFAVSEHNQRHLQYAYPDRDVLLVTYDIRSEVFQYRAPQTKQPLIACMPKATDHIAVLQQLLRARAVIGSPKLGEVRWLFLRDLSEMQVAQALGEALIFVFLSVEEGLPRMPLEAMACGCIVTAYAHGPLREYLPVEYGFEHGNLVGMALFIEEVICAHPDGSRRFTAVAERAREIAAGYSSESQERSVLAAWHQVFSKNGCARASTG